MLDIAFCVILVFVSLNIRIIDSFVNEIEHIAKIEQETQRKLRFLAFNILKVCADRYDEGTYPLKKYGMYDICVLCF